MPDGADIFLGEGKRPIGATPVTLPIDLTGVTSVKLRLKKAGYEDYEQIVVDDTPLSISLTVVGGPPPAARGNGRRRPGPGFGGRQARSRRPVRASRATAVLPSRVVVVVATSRRARSPNSRPAPQTRCAATFCDIVAAMFRGRVVAVVIPACNEADKIADTIRSVPGFVDHVIVVDDGSRDATAAIARRAAEGERRRRPHRGHRPRRATAAWAPRSPPGTRVRWRSVPMPPS